MRKHMKDETAIEQRILNALVRIGNTLDERLPKEFAERVDDATNARYERDDDRTPQPDPDTVTLRRDDVEALLRYWEIAGGNGAVRDVPRRVRAALGKGDEA